MRNPDFACIWDDGDPQIHVLQVQIGDVSNVFLTPCPTCSMTVPVFEVHPDFVPDPFQCSWYQEVRLVADYRRVGQTLRLEAWFDGERYGMWRSHEEICSIQRVRIQDMHHDGIYGNPLDEKLRKALEQMSSRRRLYKQPTL